MNILVSLAVIVTLFESPPKKKRGNSGIWMEKKITKRKGIEVFPEALVKVRVEEEYNCSSAASRGEGSEGTGEGIQHKLRRRSGIRWSGQRKGVCGGPLVFYPNPWMCLGPQQDLGGQSQQLRVLTSTRRWVPEESASYLAHCYSKQVPAALWNFGG